MKAYDASSGGEIADFTQKIPYPSHHGLPKQVSIKFLYLIERTNHFAYGYE